LTSTVRKVFSELYPWLVVMQCGWCH